MKYWFFNGSDVLGPFTPQELAARTDFSATSMICAEDASEDSAGWQTASLFKSFRFNSSTGRLARLLEQEPAAARTAAVQSVSALAEAKRNTSAACQMPMVEVSAAEYKTSVMQATPEVSPVLAEDGGKSAALLQQILDKKLAEASARPISRKDPFVSVQMVERTESSGAVLPARPATQAILRTVPSPLLVPTMRVFPAEQAFLETQSTKLIPPVFNRSAWKKWAAAGFILVLGGGWFLWHAAPAFWHTAAFSSSVPAAAVTVNRPQGRLAREAIAAVQNYPLDENRHTVADYLEKTYPTDADSPSSHRWSAQSVQKGIYIVKYKVEQPPAPPAIYLFEVTSPEGRVTGALNQITADLIGSNL